jgi:protein-L-isoaspartate(D-aspartate) O-methyltransferase
MQPGYALTFLLLVLAAASAQAQDQWTAVRQQMVRDVEGLTVETAAATGRKALDPKVTAAMAKVPRHLFVPRELRRYGYDNRPLPIQAV